MVSAPAVSSAVVLLFPARLCKRTDPLVARQFRKILVMQFSLLDRMWSL